MTKIKNVLLASAFIVTVSTAANAATVTGTVNTSDAGAANDPLIGGAITAGTVNVTDIGTAAVGSDEIIDGSVAAADLTTALQDQIGASTAGVAALNGEVNDLKGGVASAIAIATIPGVPAGKQFAVGLGGGTYDGENAGALKLSFAPQSMQSVQVNGSVTFSDSNTGAGVGVSYGF